MKAGDCSLLLGNPAAKSLLTSLQLPFLTANLICARASASRASEFFVALRQTILSV